MKRIIAMLLVCVMMLTCFTACGGNTDTPAPADNSGDTAPAADNAPAGDEGGEKVLHSVLKANISTMDCKDTTKDYFVPMNINSRLFDILVHADGTNEIVNSLCSGYEVSEDGTVYTLHLREDVTFSNGEPMTAEDVIFTFEHLLAADSVNADIPLEAVGAQAYMDGEADSVEGLAADGDYTVVITLEAANAGFIAELTSAQMGILDKTTTEAAANFGINVEETIGCGPYIVTEWVDNDHLTLVRNDSFWGETPDVEKCIVHFVPDASTQDLMYQNGELDIVDLDYIDASIVSATYLTQYADNVISRQRAALSYMAMNANDQYLSDVNVRKAIQMSIDREAILETVYNGQGVIENAIVPASIVGYNANGAEITYDPEGAKALLAAAGYGEGEVSIELSFDESANPNVKLVYQIVQQQLQAVGINAEIKSYDEASWLATRQAGEMCSFLATWTFDYNDPANIMYTFFGSEAKTTGRSLNYARTDIMDRVAAASSIVDDGERYAEYQALENIIVHEDAAWVPLYALTHMFAISDNVESFEPHWAGYGDFYIADVVMK